MVRIISTNKSAVSECILDQSALRPVLRWRPDLWQDEVWCICHLRCSHKPIQDSDILEFGIEDISIVTYNGSIELFKSAMPVAYKEAWEEEQS